MRLRRLAKRKELKMKFLELPLKKEWYNMIESGIKKEEYRIDKPYWRKRLLRCYKSIDWCDDSVSCSNCSVFRRKLFRNYTHIRFRYGYSSRCMMFVLKEITIGYGNPAWGAPKDKKVFIIKLGEKCDSRMFFNEKYFLDNGKEKD